MANNVETTGGTGGPVFKTTDTAGVHTGHVNVDSSALPTGAATEAKQDDIVTAVDAVATAVAAVGVPLTDTELRATAVPVSVSGVATAAKQDTIIGHVDGVETLLGTIDADTSALAAAVAGTEMQVDVVAALPAGDNNIGNVDIASAIPAGTNNIGDVDILSVSGGVAANAADTATPVKVGGRYDATAPTYDSGDVTNLQADARGNLMVAIRQPGADADISAGTAASDGLSSSTVGLTTRAIGYMYNGSSVDRIRGDTTNGLDVDVTRLPASLTKPLAGHYETVAASQTDQMAGATGASGDYLAGVLIIPATLSPGAVSIEDGATNIPIFVGGTDSILTLHPFFVPLGIYSVSGGWEITTGVNVSAIPVGSFT